MPSHRWSLHPCEPLSPFGSSSLLSPSLPLSLYLSLATLPDSSPFSCPAFNGDLCISLCSPNRATCVRPPRVLTLLSGLK